MTNLTLVQLEPFGVIVNAGNASDDLYNVPLTDLLDLTFKNHVTVIRGFAPLIGNALPEFCGRLGELLEWDFGTVNELRTSPDARNYLYTNREVPFHWDGAFVGRVPRFIFFHCDIAPGKGTGGQTLFSDTTMILGLADQKTIETWNKIDITYETEKIVHYDGTFRSRIIDIDPVFGRKVIRFAEPVNDLNPVRLEISGIPQTQHDSFLNDMHRRLYDKKVCYSHEWQDGDILIADNHVLLHGRRAFDNDTERLIRRVNVL